LSENLTLIFTCVEFSAGIENGWYRRIYCNVLFDFVSFLPRDAVHKRGAMSRCCPSVMFMDSVETNKHIFRFFSPSDSHIIL